jgi:hypothetical protein
VHDQYLRLDVQGADAKVVTVQNPPHGTRGAGSGSWKAPQAPTQYDQNKRVLRAMVPKLNTRPRKAVNDR